MSGYFRRSATQSSSLEKAHEARMLEQGYADGYNRLDARCLDATYQRAWRQGRARWVQEVEAEQDGR
jgi:hypothetical protein